MCYPWLAMNGIAMMSVIIYLFIIFLRCTIYCDVHLATMDWYLHCSIFPCGISYGLKEKPLEDKPQEVKEENVQEFTEESLV